MHLKKDSQSQLYIINDYWIIKILRLHTLKISVSDRDDSSTWLSNHEIVGRRSTTAHSALWEAMRTIRTRSISCMTAKPCEIQLTSENTDSTQMYLRTKKYSEIHFLCSWIKKRVNCIQHTVNMANNKYISAKFNFLMLCLQKFSYIHICSSDLLSLEKYLFFNSR